MSKFRLIFLAFLAILLTSGCSAFKTEFRDEQGRALDHPYGDERVLVNLFFIQDYPGWTTVSVNGGPHIELKPGKNRISTLTSQKYISFEVLWGEKLGYNETIRGEPTRVIGLYTGQPIIINEAFLRKVPFIEIVVCNDGPETTNYSDSQGNRFSLPPAGFKEMRVAAGDYKLTWWPSGNYQGERLRGCKTLTVGKKIFFNGKFYEERLFTNRATPNWEDYQKMHNPKGCFPL